MVSSDFFNNDELQQLIAIYRSSIEQLRHNHDNLLSMMVVVVNHYGGEIHIPYNELEEMGEGTPYNIRMAPDEQQEHMIITVEKMEDSGGNDGGPGQEAPDLSDLSGGFDNGPGTGRRPKLDA